MKSKVLAISLALLGLLTINVIPASAGVAGPVTVTPVFHNERAFKFTTTGRQFRVRVAYQDKAYSPRVGCRLNVRFSSPGLTSANYTLRAFQRGRIKKASLTTFVPGGRHRVTARVNISGKCRYQLVY